MPDGESAREGDPRRRGAAGGARDNARRPWGILALVALPACGNLSPFQPPDTRVVGQTLGTLLAVSYTASLMQHALGVGESPCYQRLLPDPLPTGGADVVTIATSRACGFPFPGEAVGTIQVAGFDPAGLLGFGVADFSGVRVDGRPLPVAQARGFLAVAPDQAPAHGVQSLPGTDTQLEPPRQPLVVIFVDLQLTASTGADQIDQGRVDEWFGFVDRRGTPDDFSDDAYWIGGQRASFAPAGAEVAQEFAAFAANCRANPQLGFVQLARASEIGKSSGIHYLVFVPECAGAGYVALSLSENFLSVGQRAHLDLLAPP